MEGVKHAHPPVNLKKCRGSIGGDAYDAYDAYDAHDAHDVSKVKVRTQPHAYVMSSVSPPLLCWELISAMAREAG